MAAAHSLPPNRKLLYERACLLTSLGMHPCIGPYPLYERAYLSTSVGMHPCIGPHAVPEDSVLKPSR
jgi:hypothetical protein